jgi:hypothetical protein
LAERAAALLAAPVFSWDWAMAALRPFTTIQWAFRVMDRDTYRRVGWSILWQLTTAQLRAGRSVVLEGVARDEEVSHTRRLASQHGGRCLVVLTSCDDEHKHRSLVEGRRRDVRSWPELDLNHVRRVRREWRAPTAVDVVLDAGVSLDSNLERLTTLISSG